MMIRRRPHALVLLIALFALSSPWLRGALTADEELDLREMFHGSIPASPFIDVIYRYADTMLAATVAGSPTFPSAMDRETLAPLEGAESTERTNLGRDQNLLRLLYFLEGLSGEKRYPRAADRALASMLERASSAMPELRCPWLLWDRCFELAPERSRRLALGLTRVAVDEDDVRRAGFLVRAWAEAHAHTSDEVFLKAIEDAVAAHLERAGRSVRPAACLSLAIDFDGAARRVREPLRTRLGRLASRSDERFLAAAHGLESDRGFFIDDGAYTPLWEAANGEDTTASVAMMCVSRYDNAGKLEYRDLLIAAADLYLDSLPGADADVWPRTFGHAIGVQLAAFRATAEDAYYRRAFRVGEIAIERFFGDRPLPRANLETDRYDRTTGVDTLMLALVELHLTARQITAVRAPVNTVDR